MEALLHIPMNLRGYLMEEVEEFLFTQKSPKENPPMVTQPSHDHSVSWLEERIDSQNVPDVAMAHISDFANINPSDWKSLFRESQGDFIMDEFKMEIRSEFKKFFRPESIYMPMYFMPAVVIAGKNFQENEVEELSWKSVANLGIPIAMPDKDTPIVKMVLSFLKKHSTTLYERVLANACFVGSPPQVIEKVGAGEFDIGIANQSFSLMGKSRGIRILPVEEGAIPLPQVMVQKKNSSIANPEALILKSSIREYIHQQGAWPLVGNETLHGFYPNNRWISDWTDWEEFLEIIASVEKDLK
ncbi:substrate-binding domain-containing protein [Tindallia californiensis]|uniref:ABC-type Fe3+ transport system, substrate-binding protein n=1 Tax=Tindallia californiensis TaxID=159292 RepID=A0A1H3MC20_9FIRM|nr:substrate-binding domain-containing protein [Tindallia californiensis]SDY74272.1 hypothetical protein SAMN05192546_10478 [Tindallia californiensis]